MGAFRFLRHLLKRALSRHRVSKPALIEHRHKALCRGDFIGTELSFEAGEFGLKIRGETVEARARRMGGAA